MPKKLKTHKSIAKRVKITKNKRVLIKTAGQDHFNARESGNTTRNKRRYKSISRTNLKAIKQALPYA